MLSNKNGAPTRTRTADPLITNQVLYQLSYRGKTMNVLADGCYCGLKKNARLEIVYF